MDLNAIERLTFSSGAPKSRVNASLTVGQVGPQLLTDTAFIEEIAHFDRERIPERVVHAKGAVALGTFKVTSNDVFDSYCSASFLAKRGQKTPIACRFSQVAAETGAADTQRDIRGFSVKFYTDAGNFDLVGNNFPVFFIRDSIKFASLIHSQKRNPKTNLKDADAFWDFVAQNPESWHAITMLFTERGIPDGFRHMHGFGVNTYKLVNSSGAIHYAKFHWICQQKIRSLDNQKATKLAGADPDYALRDLLAAIDQEKFPSWTLNIQVIPASRVTYAKFNLFDPTKTWPHAEYPLIEIGKLTLETNISNFFAQNEQLAFCPANLVPGIQVAWQDRLLAGRLFSYADAQRYRLGTNYARMPINAPKCPLATPTYRDGLTYDNNFGETSNYVPSAKLPNLNLEKKGANNNFDKLIELEQELTTTALIGRFDQTDDENFSQASILYNKVLNSSSKSTLAANLAESLKKVTQKSLIESVFKQLECVSEKLAKETKKQLAKS